MYWRIPIDLPEDSPDQDTIVDNDWVESLTVRTFAYYLHEDGLDQWRLMIDFGALFHELAHAIWKENQDLLFERYEEGRPYQPLIPEAMIEEFFSTLRKQGMIK